MAKKLIIIMANTDPRNGEELGAPIFQASVAAAMSYNVEVICTATAAKLMRRGVAAALSVKQGDAKTVYDSSRMRMARASNFIAVRQRSICLKCTRRI